MRAATTSVDTHGPFHAPCSEQGGGKETGLRTRVNKANEGQPIRRKLA